MTSEAFRRQLEAMSAQYRRELPAKLDVIERLWNDLASGKAQPARLVELVRELHSIAGSAKTFGVAGVGEAAAAAESYLAPLSRRRRSPSAAQQAGFARLLDALRRAAP